MSKRQLILEAIKCEFAKEGKPTQTAMKLYVENKISKQAYNQAAKRGYEIYERTQKNNCKEWKIEP